MKSFRKSLGDRCWSVIYFCIFCESFPHEIRASKRTREDARKGKETLQRIISYNLLGGCNFLNGLESAVLKDVQCLTLIDTASSNWAIICTRGRGRGWGEEGQGCEIVFIVLSHPLILISCNLIVEYRYLLSFFWSSQQVLNSLMLFAWSYLSVCHMCSCDYAEKKKHSCDRDLNRSGLEAWRLPTSFVIRHRAEDAADMKPTLLHMDRSDVKAISSIPFQLRCMAGRSGHSLISPIVDTIGRAKYCRSYLQNKRV